MGACQMQLMSHILDTPCCSSFRCFNFAGRLYQGRRGIVLRRNHLVVRSQDGVGSGGAWVLAVDVGTGGTKAALISSTGLITASAFSPHPAPVSPALGGIGSLEQDEECWWSATIMAVNDCMSSTGAKSQNVTTSHLGAIAVTGQMQDVIILPEKGSSSRRKAMLYSDTRAAIEAEEIAEMAGGSHILTAVTGFHQGASSLLAKLRWLDKHCPEDRGKLLFGMTMWPGNSVVLSSRIPQRLQPLGLQTFHFSMQMNYWVLWD